MHPKLACDLFAAKVCVPDALTCSPAVTCVTTAAKVCYDSCILNWCNKECIQNWCNKDPERRLSQQRGRTRVYSGRTDSHR
jgi:hypothetical protein